MEEVFTTYWDPAPIPVPTPAVEIKPAARPLSAARASAVTEKAAYRRFLNDSMNSRIALRGEDTGHYNLRWKAKLPPPITPISLLSAGDRILLHKLGGWVLWNTEGQSIASGAFGNSAPIIDPRSDVFLAADHAGLIQAKRLSDARPEYSFNLYYGAKYGRIFLASRGRNALVISIELNQDPHGPPPEKAIIEVVDLIDADHPHSFGRPDPPVVKFDRIYRSQWLVPAMVGDSLLVATHNRIFRFGAELQFERILKGIFVPKTLSLDEAGRLYAIIEEPNQDSLWVLSPEGERYYVFNLPAGVRSFYPAAIGYDHSAYLLAGDTIYKVAPDGKLQWSRSAGATIAGMLVTPDDMLIVAAGEDVSLFDARGARRTLFFMPGARFATPPIVTASGDLVVASADTLYCFSMRP